VIGVESIGSPTHSAYATAQRAQVLAMGKSVLPLCRKGLSLMREHAVSPTSHNNNNRVSASTNEKICLTDIGTVTWLNDAFMAGLLSLHGLMLHDHPECKAYRPCLPSWIGVLQFGVQ
jgi:hypothetical protein